MTVLCVKLSMPGWQKLAGFRRVQNNPSELSWSTYLQILDTKNVVWHNSVNIGIFGCNSAWVVVELQIYHINTREASSCRKYCEKAGFLKAVSPRALRKQDGFRSKIYKSRMDFVESSTKGRWHSLKALQKQDCFR